MPEKNVSSFRQRPALGLLIALGFSLLGSGCAIMPTPISQEEIKTQAASDRQAAKENVPPLVAPLSLSEAIARAIKYNLDHRVKLYEQTLAVQQLDVSRFDMLPKLVASAGYTDRSNDLISRSQDSVTGLPSLANPYISSDKAHTLYDLGLTWNLLDFGVSYYGAKQQADRILIASERRRRAMHLLVQDVRTAFWRAASAEKLQAEVSDTVRAAEEALGDSRKVEAERLRSPVDALRYQRTVLENLRILEGIQNELISARIELAALINIPQGQEYRIAEPDSSTLVSAHPALTMERMEELAVLNNAELREQFYNVRIAINDTRKSLLRLFPGLSFSYNQRHDTNSYLINKNWNEAGLQVSFNLFNLLSAPSVMALGHATESLAEQRRIAVQMAVLTQVHLARQQLDNAFRQFERSESIWKVDEKLQEHVGNRSKVELQSKLESISSSTSAIISLLRRYQALSQVYASAGKLQATLGLEPAIGSVHEIPLEALTKTIEQSVGKWEVTEPQPDEKSGSVTNSDVSSNVAAADGNVIEVQAVEMNSPVESLQLAALPQEGSK